jgi:transcriptional regulator with XRE-family HTH domain
MLGLFFLYTMKRKAKKPVINKEQALKQLGQRIKNLRMERGFTSYEYFAYENNISRAQYGRYEKGEDLRFSSLVKVISALDISIPEFFKEGFD